MEALGRRGDISISLVSQPKILVSGDQQEVPTGSLYCVVYWTGEINAGVLPSILVLIMFSGYFFSCQHQVTTFQTGSGNHCVVCSIDTVYILSTWNWQFAYTGDSPSFQLYHNW